MYIETCPDCGKEPEVIYTTGLRKSGFLVKCSCGQHANIKKSRFNAIMSWNKFTLKIKKKRIENN